MLYLYQSCVYLKLLIHVIQVQVFNTMEGRPLVPYQAVVRSSQWLAVKTRFEAAWKVHKAFLGENWENPTKNRRSNKLGLKFINSFGDDVGQWGVISRSLQAKEVVMQNYKDSEAFELGGSRRWNIVCV